MVAVDGYSDAMCVESVKLNKLSGCENETKLSEVEQAGDESHWQPEIDVMYDVDESPPVSLCLLLGFQVSPQKYTEIFVDHNVVVGNLSA